MNSASNVFEMMLKTKYRQQLLTCFELLFDASQEDIEVDFQALRQTGWMNYISLSLFDEICLYLIKNNIIIVAWTEKDYIYQPIWVSIWDISDQIFFQLVLRIKTYYISFLCKYSLFLSWCLVRKFLTNMTVQHEFSSQSQI